VTESILAPKTETGGQRGHVPMPPLVSGARPLVGHALQFLADTRKLLERGYAEHGEVFRLRLGRRPAVIMLGPDHAKWVFKQTDDQHLAIGPSVAFTRWLLGDDFYFLAEPVEYAHQRETLLPLFRNQMAAVHLAIMERHCSAFVARLGNSGTFDLPEEMNALVLGVIMEAFLGPDFARHMPRSVARDFRDLLRGLDPIVPSWVPAPHLLRARRARDRLRKAARALVRARRLSPADPPDFMQHLLAARALDGTPATDQWIVQMALGVTLAGQDSTTGHICWTVIDLLQDPAELQKVLDEQRAIMADEGPLELPAVHKMDCLDRAQRETGRLHPVAPVMLRRALRPLDVGDRTIPRGADVFVAPVLSHRLPAQFDDADRYDPDRYLAEPKLASYLHGFGGGTHRCLGEHFATLLTHVVVTRLFGRYELALVGPSPMPVRTPAFKGPRSPCRIAYRPRDHR
jgi:sterol 14alpha-demethylase